jgi:hypothetical protein
MCPIAFNLTLSGPVLEPDMQRRALFLVPCYQSEWNKVAEIRFESFQTCKLSMLCPCTLPAGEAD